MTAMPTQRCARLLSKVQLLSHFYKQISTHAAVTFYSKLQLNLSRAQLDDNNDFAQEGGDGRDETAAALKFLPPRVQRTALVGVDGGGAHPLFAATFMTPLFACSRCGRTLTAQPCAHSLSTLSSSATPSSSSLSSSSSSLSLSSPVSNAIPAEQRVRSRCVSIGHRLRRGISVDAFLKANPTTSTATSATPSTVHRLDSICDSDFAYDAGGGAMFVDCHTGNSVCAACRDDLDAARLCAGANKSSFVVNRTAHRAACTFSPRSDIVAAGVEGQRGVVSTLKAAAVACHASRRAAVRESLSHLEAIARVAGTFGITCNQPLPPPDDSRDNDVASGDHSERFWPDVFDGDCPSPHYRARHFVLGGNKRL
jgi:hypothetical protein